MATYWNTEDAALDLGHSLKRIAELEAQKAKYDYRYPESLGDDIRTEADKVRDAIRHLMSTEAD